CVTAEMVMGTRLATSARLVAVTTISCRASCSVCACACQLTNSQPADTTTLAQGDMGRFAFIDFPLFVVLDVADLEAGSRRWRCRLTAPDALGGLAAGTPPSKIGIWSRRCAASNVNTLGELRSRHEGIHEVDVYDSVPECNGRRPWRSRQPLGRSRS